MKQYLLTLSILFLFADIFAQSPQGFNYQAVARDSKGELLINKTLQVRATMYSGSSGSSKEYQETHGITTNKYGLFNVVIGEGSVVSGQFNLLAWGAKAHYLQIEINGGSGYVAMGKVKLQSVPYALFSGSAGSAEGNNDPDSTNEIQVLSISGNIISLSKGGSVNIPINLDNSITNEIQQLSISGATISLSDGGSVNIPLNKDSSLTNELQTLSISNDTVFLTDGGFAKLPSGQSGTYTSGTGIDISTGVISALNTGNLWNANKIQGKSISALSPSVDDILLYDGSTWNPEKLNKTPWKKDGNNIYFDEFVGINIDAPTFRLHIFDSIYGAGKGLIMTQNYLHGGTDAGYRNYAFRSVVEGHGGGDNTAGAFYSIEDVSTTGTARGVIGLADGDGQNNYGIQGIAGEDGTGRNYGVVAGSNGKGTFNMGILASANRSSTNTNYGIYATADSSSTRYAGYFAGNVAYTGTLTNASDIKLKKDINNLHGAVDIVKSLSPKTYYFKKEGDAVYLKLPTVRQYGFLAQDLEKVLPNLVHKQVQPKSFTTEGSVEYKGVDYISLIPILTQAIKEQQEMIELLQKRLNELEKH